MAYTTVVAGTTITAAWGNAVRDQQVSTFASVAARTSAVTSPVEGMLTVTIDTNSIDAYSGSAHVPIANYGAWTDYTPQLDQGASTNIAKTVSYARYIKIGRMVTVAFRLDVTGAGTAGSAIAVALPPFTPVFTTNLYVGSAIMSDASAPILYGGQAVITSTTRVQIWKTGTTPTDAPIGVSPAIAVATGDAVIATFEYESTT